MDIELKNVHVGNEIAKRIQELDMSKTEFGRLIGVQQQHVNRILERETMETSKLVNVCNALDLNIFAKFCSFPTKINAYLAAVSMAGNANNCVGDASMLAELEIKKTENIGLQQQIEILKGQIAQLQSQLEDKDHIISLLNNKNS